MTVRFRTEAASDVTLARDWYDAQSPFPYALYYRRDGIVVDVIACLHTRRSPSRWRTRR